MNPFNTKLGYAKYARHGEELRVYDLGDDDPTSEDFRVALGFKALAWGTPCAEIGYEEVERLHEDLGKWLEAKKKTGVKNGN